MQARCDPSGSKRRDIFYRVILGCLAVGIVFLLLDRWHSDLTEIDRGQGQLQEAAAPMGYEWQVVIEGVASAARKTATIQLVVVLLATLGIYAFCLHVISLEEALTSSGVIERDPSRWSKEARRRVNRAYILFSAGWAAALGVVLVVQRCFADPLGTFPAKTSERFETVVTQNVMVQVFQRAGDVFAWLGPIMFMVLLGFLPLCRVTALLRASTEERAHQGTPQTPQE